MPRIQQCFAQVALWNDEVAVWNDEMDLLREEYRAAKRDQDAPFQQEQSEAEKAQREAEKALETIKRNREAAAKEVDRKYQAKFDELTRLLPQLPDQAAKSPASSNVGPGVREEQDTDDRLANDDGPGDDNGLEHNHNGPEHNHNGPEHNHNSSEDSDNRPEDDGGGSDYGDDQRVDGGDDPGDDDHGSSCSDSESDNDSRLAHNDGGPTSAALNSPRALRKRQPAKVESDLERPKKRHRNDAQAAGSGSVEAPRVGEATSDRTEKTISFEDVFGRHRIIPWPAASHCFYILRCSHHGKTFNSKDPAQGAGKHLSKIHGTTGTHEYAIKELGVRVQNCTQEQVDESNYAVDQLDHAVNQPRRRSTSNRKTSIQPISGVFYKVYWHAGGKTRSGTRSGTPFVALCLPTDSFDAVGISGSIHDTDLVRSIPVCYRTHTRTKKILGWNEDYQDGGIKASRRKFPFLFFNGGLQLPSEGKLSIPRKGKMFSWVAVNNIQPLDLNDSTTSHIPGHATALMFTSRLLHQHESATATNNQSSAAESGPLSGTGNDDGFGDQSRAEGGQEALALIASASLLASDAETTTRSANAEQPAADTSRSELKPAPSDRAGNSASSASSAPAVPVQGPDSQLPGEDADTAQNGPTLVSHLPSNSEDSRPSSDNRPDSENNGRCSEDSRPSFEKNGPNSEENRPGTEDNRPNFENNRPRPENNGQDICAEAVVGAPQSRPDSDGWGRDSRAERGSLSFILGASIVEK
ncbi:hypothetical protein RB595_008926 [Gaeumannomyces hyphopodioides]